MAVRGARRRRQFFCASKIHHPRVRLSQGNRVQIESAQENLPAIVRAVIREQSRLQAYESDRYSRLDRSTPNIALSLPGHWGIDCEHGEIHAMVINQVKMAPATSPPSCRRTCQEPIYHRIPFFIGGYFRVDLAARGEP